MEQQPSQQGVFLTPEMLQNIISSSVSTALQSMANNNIGAAPRGERPTRPLLSIGINQEQWTHFKTKWNRYKSLAQLRPNDINNQLLECCDDDLQLALDRAHGQGLLNLSEAEMLKKLKSYAVKAENVLINRNIMAEMNQNQDEDVIHFAARLQGQAKSCNFSVRTPDGTSVSYADHAVMDQLCRGLADVEIQQEVLTRYDNTLTIDKMVSFISAREASKRCQVQLMSNASASRISPY